jgi:hypothetical protein
VSPYPAALSPSILRTAVSFSKNDPALDRIDIQVEASDLRYQERASKASYPTEAIFSPNDSTTQTKIGGLRQRAGVYHRGRFCNVFLQIRRAKKESAQKAFPHHTFSTPNVFCDPS